MRIILDGGACLDRYHDAAIRLATLEKLMRDDPDSSEAKTLEALCQYFHWPPHPDTLHRLGAMLMRCAVEEVTE